MALTLPLYQRSGSLLFLDDDLDYLEMLGMVLPAHLQIELYCRSSSFIDRMREEPARWEADAGAHLLMIDRWRRGQPLIPQVLRYWASSAARYQLAQICIVDYALPGTDGLKVLNTLLDWPGARVLLTGQADEQIAIQAFNSGLIDQFIPKQASDISGRLLKALGMLSHAPHPRLNTLWRAALQPSQQSILQIPAVARELQAYALKNWIEYVVLGEPFGLLGLDASGNCHWLQLEPSNGLNDLAELASSAGLGFDVARAVSEGRLLPAVEIHQQLGMRGPIRTAETFDVGDDGMLKAASFRLEADDLPQAIYPYHNFLEVQGSRKIQDI